MKNKKFGLTKKVGYPKVGERYNLTKKRKYPNYKEVKENYEEYWGE